MRERENDRNFASYLTMKFSFLLNTFFKVTSRTNNNSFDNNQVLLMMAESGIDSEECGMKCGINAN